MSDIAIRVEGLSKRYRIGQRERYLALRDVLTDVLYAPIRGLSSIRRWTTDDGRQPSIVHHPSSIVHRPSSDNYIWALKDVSFEVKQGEVVGIIGRNGAGKTTLLKILARITKPTAGYAEIRGRVGSLLEVGTGFHPELTGRENIYLSGAILGMTKQEIDRKFDEIVDFAGVEAFIDTPLKYYSTGMQMRLAFAVAAHLDPEILLVDEVLAVGDLEFQKKCLGKMEEVSKGGRTVLFVSHQMNQIRRLCERVMWIDGGHVVEIGATHEVITSYEQTVMDMGRKHTQGVLPPLPKNGTRFLKWEIIYPANSNGNVLSVYGGCSVRFVVRIDRSINKGHHGIHLYDNNGKIVWGKGIDALNIPSPGTYEFIHEFPILPLRPGVYEWLVTLYDDRGECLDWWHAVPMLVVVTEDHQHPREEWAGVLNIRTNYSIREIKQDA